MTYEEFLADPQAQERVIMGEFQEVLKANQERSEEEIVRRAAAEWYAGPGGVKHWNNPGYHANVPGEPNMQEYTLSVCNATAVLSNYHGKTHNDRRRVLFFKLL